MNQSFFYSCDYNNKDEKKKCKPCSLPPCSIIIGPTGPTGSAGTSGILGFADFYALMPPDNAAALTITPLAGGTQPVSAHLVIKQIQ